MTGHGPFGTGSFSVEIAAGDAGEPAIESGFASVGFPDFGVEHDSTAHLVLRRAVTGTRELYAWWDKARSGGKAARDVRIRLIGADREQVVMAWTFRAARPVLLSHTPLDANAPGLMLETLALTFDRMDVDYPGDPKPKPPVPGRIIR
jgi:hypothetical protein